MDLGGWAYRIAGAVLVWAATSLTGANIGLVVAGPGSNGLDLLGAALVGFMAGAVAGLALAMWFAWRSPPAGAVRRTAVLALLLGFAALALGIQEALD